MDNRTRNTVILIIVSVIFLALGKWVGYMTVTGLFLIVLAIHMIRKDDRTVGFIMLVAGIVIAASEFFVVLLILFALLLVYYYSNTKSSEQHENIMQSFSLVKSWQQTKEPWVLTDTRIRSLISEINIDLSLAINEKEITIFHLEGIIGDIDLVIPEDVGVSIEASVLLGEIKFGQMKEEGAMNKMIWHTPNYDSAMSKVRLIISYAIGEVNVRFL